MTSKENLPTGLRGSVVMLLAKLVSAASEVYGRNSQAIGIAVLVCFAIGFMATTLVRPVYNWDLLAYLGVSAKSWLSSASEIHSYVYGFVREHISAEAFQDLTQGDAFRLRQFSDPEAFVSMFGMYEVKWIYILLLEALVPLLGPLHAYFAINCVAMVILTVSLGLWLRATKLLGYAPVVVLLLFVLQFQSFAVTQQPDFLANSIVLAGLLSLERSRDRLGALLIILGVLVRPDQVATLGVLFFCAWLLRDRATGLLLASFGLALVAWIGFGRIFPGVGWWPHLWFSTYHMQDTMVGFKPDFSLKVYVTAIAYNLYRSLFENTWLAVYGLLVILSARLIVSAAVPAIRRQVVLMGVMLAIPAKFVVFPLHDGRIYFSLLFAACLIMLAELVSERKVGH